MSKFYAYIKCKLGATAIEYGLIAAFIALAIVGTVIVFGNDLNNLYYVLLPDIY